MMHRVGVVASPRGQLESPRVFRENAGSVA